MLFSRKERSPLGNRLKGAGMEANELLRVQHEVTSERDPEKRRAAIDQAYVEDLRFLDVAPLCPRSRAQGMGHGHGGVEGVDPTTGPRQRIGPLGDLGGPGRMIRAVAICSAA